MTLDNRLTFEHHVSAISKSCFFHIRAFRHIRAALTQEMANSVAVSLVTSRLDYANSLLFGTSQANLNKLQRIQNTLAKLVDPSHTRSSDALHTLHWLPVRQRINFKIATLTFKLLQHSSPAYLASLIQPYVPSRALRSHGQQLLAQPHVRTSVIIVLLVLTLPSCQLQQQQTELRRTKMRRTRKRRTRKRRTKMRRTKKCAGPECAGQQSAGQKCAGQESAGQILFRG